MPDNVHGIAFGSTVLSSDSAIAEGDYLRRSGSTLVGDTPTVSEATAATSVESELAFDIDAAVGTSTAYARADHTHGTPAEDLVKQLVMMMG